jgi:hypothetical protein
MASQFSPTADQIGELVRLARLGRPTIDNVVRALTDLDDPIIHPQALLRIASSFLDQRDAERLVRHALSLHGMARQTGRDVATVLPSVRLWIQRYAETHRDPEAPQAWLGVEDAFRALLATKCVRLTAAAVDLAYDYTNLLRRTRILTDLRPIYSLGGDEIEGAVVSYTLRLRYDSAEGEHEISIAMDAADVEAMIHQCSRAKLKATVARDLMTRACHVPATISGEVSE